MRARADQSRAFTLLEVILATMVVGMLALTLYRFLGSHLTAMRTTTELGDERETLQAVVRLIEGQLRELPPVQEGALLGRPYRFKGLSNDELSWRSEAGSGLLTSAASGEYRVTLTVQPVTATSAETELGLRRRSIDTRGTSGTEINRGGAGMEYNWLPLVRPMAALEVRYYDATQKSWTDAWLDGARRPSLVRVRLWRNADDLPVEAVLPVPSGT